LLISSKFLGQAGLLNFMTAPCVPVIFVLTAFAVFEFAGTLGKDAGSFTADADCPDGE
jgi:hypothetical protein